MAIRSTGVYREFGKLEVYVEVDSVADMKAAQDAVTTLFGQPARVLLIRGVFAGVEPPTISQAPTAGEREAGGQGDYSLEEHSYPAIEVMQKDCLYIIDRHGAKIELVKKQDGKPFKVCFEVRHDKA